MAKSRNLPYTFDPEDPEDLLELTYLVEAGVFPLSALTKVMNGTVVSQQTAKTEQTNLFGESPSDTDRGF